MHDQYVATRSCLREDPLSGHGNWVTALATCPDVTNTDGVHRELLLSASRDRSVLIWELTGTNHDVKVPRYSLKGHNGFVNAVAVSPSGTLAATASSDKTIRIWDIATRKKVHVLTGHTDHVTCVAFIDNQYIVSGSRDRSLKVWSVEKGDCWFTIKDAHDHWISDVKGLTAGNKSVIVSCGWDKRCKVWETASQTLRQVMLGDDGYVNAVAVTQDGSILATAGKMGKVHLWDINNNSFCFSVDAKDVVNALAFSPKNFLLCAATKDSVKVWDIENDIHHVECFQTSSSGDKKSGSTPSPISLTWSEDGCSLFVGYSDSKIRVIDFSTY